MNARKKRILRLMAEAEADNEVAILSMSERWQDIQSLIARGFIRTEGGNPAFSGAYVLTESGRIAANVIRDTSAGR